MDREDKREAIFQALFDEVEREIEKVYLPGTMAYIREHHKELYETILSTVARLNELWLAIREGRNTLDKFREALKIWKDLHFKAIELYRGQRDRKEGEQRNLF